MLDMVRRRVELEMSFGIDRLPRSLRRPPSPPPAGGKAEQLRAIEAEAAQCQACTLHRTRTNPVFGVGDPDADLMFVGEAPGEQEDLQGEPFVGPAGQLLTRMIEAIQMKRPEVYIANILKCRPPGNRAPLPEEIAVCTAHLRRQIAVIQPKLICTLGAFAVQALLSTKQSVGSLRGRVHNYDGISLVATYHPSYLLRYPGEKAKAWEDLQKVRDLLKELKARTGYRAAEKES
jgi:DNA polymerase